MTRGPGLARLRRLGGDAGLVGLGQLISYAYPLISIPLLSRVLGIDGLGLFITTLAIIQMLHVWTDFGFGFSALRRMSVAASAEERQAVAASTITAKLFLWVVGSAVMVIVAGLAPSLREHIWFFVIGAVISIGVPLYPMWHLQATGQLKLLAGLTGGSRCVALAGLVVTVRAPSDLGLAIFWQFIPFLLSAIVSWIVIARQRTIRLRLSPPAAAMDALADSTPLFVNLISGQVIVNSSTILLSQFSGYRQVGLFGPGDRLVSAVHGVLVSIEQIMLPRVSVAYQRPEEPNERKLVLLGLVGCYAASGLGLAAIAPVLIPWYLGPEFEAAVPIVQVMGLATVLSGVARTLMLDLVAAGRSKASTGVIAVSAAWHLVTAAFAAWQWGAMGVAVALCGTQSFMAIGLWAATRRGRHNGVHPPDVREASIMRGMEGWKSQMRVSFMIEALTKRVVLILMVGVLVAGGVVASAAGWPKTYTSKAQILLGVARQGNSIDAQTGNLYLKERVATFAQTVKADEVVEPVASGAGMSAIDLRRRISVAIIPETVVLEIGVSAESPDAAVNITNAVSRRFRSQVSSLNVETGGPSLVAAQFSSPQPADAPDQLHGSLLYLVAVLVGLVVGVIVALLLAVIQINRASRRGQDPDGDGAAEQRARTFRLSRPTGGRFSGSSPAGGESVPAGTFGGPNSASTQPVAGAPATRQQS